MLEELLNNSGVMLGITGYVGYIIRDLPSRISFLIKQKFTVDFDVCSDDPYVYQNTITYLQELCPDLSNHVQFFGNDEIKQDLAVGEYCYFLDPLTYIRINKQRMEHTLNNIKYVITCYIVGKNRKKYFNDYYSYIEKTLPITGNYLRLNLINDHYIDHQLINKRTWDTLYLDKDIKSNLQNIVNTFINNKEFYHKREITYKTGILLYGPPGSGKSTIAKVIASSLNWNILYMTTAAHFLPIREIRNTVILIEDIDCFSLENRSTTSENEEPNRTNTVLNLHSLLNYIDGTISPSNVIFIATTNYIEKIDSALLRPGRFDHVLEIPYMSKELAEEMIQESTKESFKESTQETFKETIQTPNKKVNLDGIEFPCSPAVIQNRLLSTL